MSQFNRAADRLMPPRCSRSSLGFLAPRPSTFTQRNSADKTSASPSRPRTNRQARAESARRRTAEEAAQSRSCSMLLDEVQGHTEHHHHDDDHRGDLARAQIMTAESCPPESSQAFRGSPRCPRFWGVLPSSARKPLGGAASAQRGPNHVLSASRSPSSVPIPTQATCPSGRINTAVGAGTAPSTGSSHAPA